MKILKPTLFLATLVAIFATMYALGKAYSKRHLTYVSSTGDSMLPTLPISNGVYEAISPDKLERGDIIVLKDDQNENAQKRIIGLPNEIIDITNGSVYVNGSLLHEPYLAPGTITPQGTAGGHIVVKPEEYLVMGDNRKTSYDGRFYGPRPRSAIMHKLNIYTQEGTTNEPAK